MSRYVAPAVARGGEDRRVEARVAGVEDRVGALGGAPARRSPSASEASSCAAPKRSSPVARAGARLRALAVDVGQHEVLEEPAMAGDGGGRGAHAARSDDEDAHARERTAR